jgi:hypothetical protein
MAKFDLPYRIENEHLFLLALAAITAVAAVAVGPVSCALAIILWLLTVALMVSAFCWDYIRWQFLTPAIKEQIRKGFALLSSLDTKRIAEWDAETLGAIDEQYGKSSFQYQRFYILSESKHPDPVLLLRWKLACLKGLATAWLGPSDWR